MLGDVVEVDIGLLKQKSEDFWGVMQHCELERSIVIESGENRAGSFDQQE